MNHLLKLALGLKLITVVTPLHAQESQLNFSNGDSLKGKVMKLTPTDIHFQHPAFKEKDNTQVLQLDKIESITSIKKLAPPSNTFESIGHLTMVPRFNKNLKLDVYQGMVKTITDQHVLIDTTYAGELKLNKKFLTKLDIYNNKGTIIPNLGKLDDWIITPADSNILEKEGTFHFPRSNNNRRDSNRVISQKVDYPELFHHRFSISKQNPNDYLNFFVGYFGNKTAQSYPEKTSIVLSVNYNKLQLVKDDEQGRVNLAERRLENIDANVLKKKLVWVFDTYVNTKEKTLSVYINDSIVFKNIDLQNIDLEEKGEHLYFKLSSANSTLELKELTLRHWSGSKPAILPKNRIQLNEEGKYVRLQNGDLMLGTIQKIEDGAASIKTEYGVFKVKLSNISTLDVGNKEEEEIKMCAGDARLTFFDGSKFIVEIKNIENGFISGSSQVFEGVQQFDLKQIYSIEFQNSIYPN